MTDKNHIHHVQYPVGQGGLHLGIIGNVAYIYDCGGCGKNVDWDNIFDDIVVQLSQNHCTGIHIFISHWHYDHMNKLDDLCYCLKKNSICHYLHTSPINNFQKIAYLCEFNGSNEEYNKYYDDIVETNMDTSLDNIPEFLHVYQRHPSKKILEKLDFQLSQECQKLYHHSNLQRLLNDMRNINIQQQIKPRYNIVKHINRYTNHRYMLCLYCYTPLNESSNWLHTGDATMASKYYRQKMSKYYSSVGLSLKNANIIQIPHHASRYNHNKNFIDIFDSKYIRLLYYTIEGGRVKSPVVSDIVHSGIPFSRIRPVSASPSTKI